MFKRRLTLQVLTLCCAALISWGAAADMIDAPSGTMPGCDRDVLNAMSAKANARVAYDVATTEQVIDKPDSILAMSCFNDSAGNSALQVGQMFGGDFTVHLAKMVPDALTSFYDDYVGAIGYDDPTLRAQFYTGQTALGTSVTTCDNIQNLWDFVKQEGIQKNIPYPKYSDYVTGTPPNGVTTILAGSNFEKDWNQSVADNDFSDVSNAITALPVANTPTTFMSSQVNTDDACAVMFKAGITGSAACP